MHAHFVAPSASQPCSSLTISHSTVSSLAYYNAIIASHCVTGKSYTFLPGKKLGKCEGESWLGEQAQHMRVEL